MKIFASFRDGHSMSYRLGTIGGMFYINPRGDT
jgi:hypothetical protein